MVFKNVLMKENIGTAEFIPDPTYFNYNASPPFILAPTPFFWRSFYGKPVTWV
ncbi:hypothetical protein KTT_01290 [Tengunoibacter tsumagoiensis]|uniref:Uncharacterized protein n=1 Tax=Tengunoibacter tsumagoiensis TaxID=2014871 RepID=A0A401ZU20_9CHLR|nr:hypothetical protein KTT_01290 [Tengunoibacter tsumagoiensis]